MSCSVRSKCAPTGGHPDVVVIGCPPREDLIGLVRTRFPASRVLGLVGSADPGDVAVATQEHADGYLMLHDVTEMTLGDTLRAMMHGGLPMSRPIADYLLDSASATDIPIPAIHGTFNARERDVITLLLEGLSNQQIARRLDISLHSAKRHVSAVLQRVNSPSRAHFVATMLRDATRPRDARPASRTP